MKSRWIGLVVFLSFAAIFFSLAHSKSVPDLGGSSAWGDDDDKLPFPKNATVTTLITTPRRIDGLTGDNHRNLYTVGLRHASLRGLANQPPQTQPNSGRIHCPRCRKLRFQWELRLTRTAICLWLTATSRAGPFTRLAQAPRIRPTPPFSPQAFREPTASPSIRRETSGLVTE